MTTSTLAERPSLPAEDTSIRLQHVARWLSLITGGLMVIAAAAGLLAADLYRDPDGIRHMLRGHDAITLVVVAPLFAWSLRAAQRGSARARAAWLGVLAFATYNYAVYVLGSGFNDLFLVHVAILGAAAVALALGLLATRPHDAAPPSRRDARVVAGLLLFLAIGLGAMWVFNALRFAINGETPAESELVLPLASIHLGYALDLLLIVPAYTAAAVLLWRRNRWGSVFAPVVLVGGLLQQLTYISALVFQHRADLPGATAFDPGEPIVVVAHVGALWLLLRKTRREEGALR